MQLHVTILILESVARPVKRAAQLAPAGTVLRAGAVVYGPSSLTEKFPGYGYGGNMGYGYGGPMGYGYGGDFMYGFGGWIMWIVIIALACAVIYYLVTQSKNTAPSSRGPSGETALDILKKRFARGEISKEEFQSMKRELQDQS